MCVIHVVIEYVLVVLVGIKALMEQVINAVNVDGARWSKYEVFSCHTLIIPRLMCEDQSIRYKNVFLIVASKIVG